MSNTLRWVQPGWDGSTLVDPPKSKKHQMKDRRLKYVKERRFNATGRITKSRQLVKDERRLSRLGN